MINPILSIQSRLIKAFLLGELTPSTSKCQNLSAAYLCTRGESQRSWQNRHFERPDAWHWSCSRSAREACYPGSCRLEGCCCPSHHICTRSHSWAQCWSWRRDKKQRREREIKEKVLIATQSDQKTTSGIQVHRLGVRPETPFQCRTTRVLKDYFFLKVFFRMTL